MSLNTQNTGTDESKLDNKYQSILSNNKKSSNASGSDVKDIPHNNPTDGKNTEGPMEGNLMTFTKMLESLEYIIEMLSDPQEEDISEMPVEDPTAVHQTVLSPEDETELMDKLNQIFTPILVMQGFEGNISDHIQEAFSEASVLMERNIISFDDKTRMAQLISTCALLISQKKNTEKFRMYAQAAELRNKMKIEIQKDEYDEAKALAQKFLVKVSTTNNSSYARDAATDLLPQTQH